jgi:hypothetical protein
MWDIALAVLDAVFLSLGAYSGLHATLHPTESTRRHASYKAGFVICSVVVCILSGVLAWRNNETQRLLDSRIQKLQHDVIEPHPAYAAITFEVLPTSPPDRNGRITLQFITHNKSAASTGPGELWVHVCDKCGFWDDNGFKNFSGPNGKDRTAHFEYLDAGVHSDVWKIGIRVPRPPTEFELAFFYSCLYCRRDATAANNWYRVHFPPFFGNIISGHVGG